MAAGQPPNIASTVPGLGSGRDDDRAGEVASIMVAGRDIQRTARSIEHLVEQGLE